MNDRRNSLFASPVALIVVALVFGFAAGLCLLAVFGSVGSAIDARKSLSASPIPDHVRTSCPHAPDDDSETWCNYFNPQYRLGVRYPIYATPTTTSEALVQFDLKAPDDALGALYIGAKSNLSSASMTDCLLAPESAETDVENVATTTISGFEFLSFESLSSASGYDRYSRTLRGVYQERCFVILEEIWAPTEVFDNAISRLRPSLDSMLSTVRLDANPMGE